MSYAALKEYQKVSVTASVDQATPHQLIQMLMAGALAQIAKAKGNMSANRIAEKSTCISTATSIVLGLQASLDMKKGGDIAVNLNNLYGFIIEKLAEANLNNDMSCLDDAGRVLGILKSGWDGIEQPTP